jgi:hypothetical protein
MVSFLSAYSRARHLTGSPQEALTAAFIYAVNPWVATNPRNLILKLKYALFPLLFLLQLKHLNTGKPKYVVYVALVLGAVNTARS